MAQTTLDVMADADCPGGPPGLGPELGHHNDLLGLRNVHDPPVALAAGRQQLIDRPVVDSVEECDAGEPGGVGVPTCELCRRDEDASSATFQRKREDRVEQHVAPSVESLL